MKTIILPASPKDTLDWDILFKQEESFAGKILWQLDFGWQNSPLNIWNTASFQAHLLAVEECVKHLQKKFLSKKQTISFLHVQQPFTQYLSINELLETRYKEFLQTRKDDPLLLELFVANLLSDYLHRLASVLPNEYQSALVIEHSFFAHKAFFAHLFCSRRFAHFKNIYFKKKIFAAHPEPTIGIVIPQDELVSPSVFDRFNDIMKYLEENKLKFSFIPEEILNETWEGIEYLILIKSLVTPLGMRMLHGFTAAGGKIISVDEKIGFEEEIVFEEFLETL